MAGDLEDVLRPPEGREPLGGLPEYHAGNGDVGLRRRLVPVDTKLSRPYITRGKIRLNHGFQI